MRSASTSKNLLNVCILIVVCCFDVSSGRPAEQPTKINLGIADNLRVVDSTLASGLERIQELLGHVADAIRIAAGRFVNSVTLARNIIADRAETLTSESRVNVARTEALNHGPRSADAVQQPPVTNTRPNARETVRLEYERDQSLLERPVPKPVNGVLESFLQPTPLVDGIREEDKYGNAGDKFIGLGRALVNGFEGFSNFLNSIVDLPRNSIKNTSRGITEALNHVGAKLVGLE